MGDDVDQIEGPLEDNAVPLCLRCLAAVDPLDKACANCGGAVGQLTPYLPFESIPWAAGGWGNMWHQMLERKASIAGRVFRFLVIVNWAPILLVGVFPLLWRKLRGGSAQA